LGYYFGDIFTNASGHPAQSNPKNTLHRALEKDTGKMRSKVVRFFLVQNTKTGENIPDDHHMYIPMYLPKYIHTIKITNRPKIYEHFPFQGLPRHIQIRIFGNKI
jgi:hypothetical protein